MAVNPFKDDQKIWLFHFMTLGINLPRLYAGYLCYKWIKSDDRITRKCLATSFLIWFAIDLALAFHFLIGNRMLFGTFYKCYIYKKRYILGPDHPKGIP